jgi:hypothetical protein
MLHSLLMTGGEGRRRLERETIVIASCARARLGTPWQDRKTLYRTAHRTMRAR